MKNLQVTVPRKFKSDAKETLEEFSSDLSSSEVEKDETKSVEFSVTVDSNDIDDLTEELKGITDLKSGELSIRVLDQESLIKKGQKTRGSMSTLSQEEIYSKAQEFSGFAGAQWGLIAVSSAIAAYGLALDNLIVVIGAMMLAPILSPFVSGALSLAVGDSSLMKASLRAGVLSVLLAVAVAYVAVLPFPVSVNPTMGLVVSPGILTVLLSLLVGSAAALTFSTGLRDQVAGVAVAIALVPPLAAVGIGLKMQSLQFSIEAASIAIINILSVLVSGFLTFKLLGMKPSTYYRKKEAEKLRYLVPAALILLLALAAPVVYSSFQDYQSYVAEEQFRDTAESYFGDALLKMDLAEDSATLYVVGRFNASEFRRSVNRSVEFVQLERN
ncbi:MAG: TIGR00341 family protein [Candidatus Nanohaloarchaea archaeon]